jgi:hypothetical protein
MKIGFICEGKTEKKIVESKNFQQFLISIGIECVPDIIDVAGYRNLSAEKLPAFSQTLTDNGAQKIVILTDLDTDACITLTKERVNASQDHLVIVSVRQAEAWFLADDACMSAICKTNIHVEWPEKHENPFQTIRELLLQNTTKGVGDKILLAAKVMANNFSILNAAAHPNCPSAKYFIQKLKTLSAQPN